MFSSYKKDDALSLLNISENVRLQKSHSNKSMADRNTDNTTHNVSPTSNTIEGQHENCQSPASGL